ncbi:Hypothetical predicted protein, partial [Pelobates cultripes]
GCGGEWSARAFHKHYVRSCDRTTQEMVIESEAGSGCGEEWNARAFHKYYVRSCDRKIQEMSIESEIMRSTDETGSRRCAFHR